MYQYVIGNVRFGFELGPLDFCKAFDAVFRSDFHHQLKQNVSLELDLV